eukprot:gb/GFBE01075190.1/.p1 GENE.gb/GFBE01075190.1/~~gb/GFBE01075190.1/.p1  ORF type:complete len:375 (+),score=86.75 gb/GFBE01075190.1/:1-1125(+)
MSSRRSDFQNGAANDELEIPDHLGTEVTFDQKKRLARLAKMGIGPVARAGAPQAPAARALTDDRTRGGAIDSREALLQERRLALIEQERRLRSQEEAKRLEEEREVQEKLKKSTRNRAGLAPLGAVQPREEPPNARYPTPASAPAMFEEVERRPVSGAAEPEEEEDDEVDEGEPDTRRFAESAAPREASERAAERERLSAEAQVLAELRAQRKQAQVSQARPAQEPKKKGKKRKKAKRKDKEDSGASDDDAAESEDSADDPSLTVQAKKQARDGGISWKMMSVESVKGRVSSDNKRMTDADLERRFAVQESSSNSGLMSEAQVKAMIQKERKKSHADVNSARRVQRELEEWQNTRNEKMARLGNEKERLVVARK